MSSGIAQGPTVRMAERVIFEKGIGKIHCSNPLHLGGGCLPRALSQRELLSTRCSGLNASLLVNGIDPDGMRLLVETDRTE